MQWKFGFVLFTATLPSCILAESVSDVEKRTVTPALQANLTGIITALNTTYTQVTNNFHHALAGISSRNESTSDDFQTVWQSNYVYQQAVAGNVAVAIDAAAKLVPGAKKEDLEAIRNTMASAFIIQQNAGAVPFEQAYTVLNYILGLNILE